MGLFYLQDQHNDRSQPMLRVSSVRLIKRNHVPVSKCFLFSGLFFQQNFGRSFSKLRDYPIKPG